MEEFDSAKKEFVTLLKKLLDVGDTTEALKVAKENRNILKEAGWELIPLLCEAITEENFASIPLLRGCISQLLEDIVTQANHKEALLILLEQTENIKDTSNDSRFKMLLHTVQIVLLRLPNKRKSSLEWTANTFYGYVLTMPLPQSYNFEKEERLLMDSDENIIRLSDVIPEFVHFYQPFVNELSVLNNDSNDKQQLKSQRDALARFLLLLFDHPLVFVDLSLYTRGKSKLRVCAEDIVEYLTNIMGDFYQFFNHKSRISIPQESGDYSDKISDLSLGTLFYVCLYENIGTKSLPCVYSSRYILEQTLPLSICLLRRSEECALHKGLLLAEAVISRVSNSCLSFKLLDNNAHMDLFAALINVMVYCPISEFRQIASKLVPNYINKFEEKGRFELLRCLLSCNKHSGVLGFLIGLVKENLRRVLDKSDLVLNYFAGDNLVALCRLIFVLPLGVETDLLENSDHILASLNLLRFLLLRDQKNCTGIFQCVPNIKVDFLEPLRKGLDLSIAHYQLKARDLNEGKHLSRKSLEDDESMSPEYVTTVSLNMLDLIQCVLSRVEELC